MRKEHFSRKTLKSEDEIRILVVIPQWQYVGDKLRIKTIHFRKHKSLVKREMETLPLKQVQLGIKYVLPGLQARKESAAWRYSQSGPKRAPETGRVPLPLSHVSCFLLFPTPLTLLEEQPKCCQCGGQRKEGRDLKMDKPSSCLQNLKVILMSYCCRLIGESMRSHHLSFLLTKCLC